ncbi:PTPRU phosphatase, partial [Polyodon spathula]|nr:PTPRU phosphatase [Polyodon spathula]
MDVSAQPIKYWRKRDGGLFNTKDIEVWLLVRTDWGGWKIDQPTPQALYGSCAEEGNTSGCTFDEDSDPSLCEYSQGEEDDFDWQLVNTYPAPHSTSDLLHGSYMMVNSSQHASGQRARLLLQRLSENDTHCVQFSYFLYSRDGHSPGALHAFVRVNNGPLGSSVWNISGSHGRQWHQVELAVSTFWPNEYQVWQIAKGQGVHNKIIQN